MKVKLKDVLSDFIVPMRDKPKRFDGTIPWCRIEDIKGKYLSDTLSQQYVSEETVQSMNLKVYPINTLLFTCSATIGVTALTTKPLCTNQTFIGLVPSDKIDIEYLYYYLKLIGKRLKKSASITTIPYLSRSFFENLEIELPPMKNQKEISLILHDIDDKIELNDKFNYELEAMAKLIYDYWFVQFDFPNKNGKPYKSSGGKMLYCEELKREIPKGWRVEKLTSCSEIIDCLHSKKSDYLFEDKKYFLLQLENIKDDGLIDLSKKYYVSKDEYKRWTTRIEVKDHDLVITNAGRVAGLSQIPKGVVAGIGRNITAIRPENISPTFLYYSFQGAEMERQIKLNTDTGSFFKSLNVRGIKELFIVRPHKELEEKFEEFALSHRRKRESNSKQNQKLTELRDWLLPMLMNGQVKVGEQKEQLNIAAEPGAAYEKDKASLDSLFETINYDYEVAAVVLLTRQILDRTYGRKFIHKMFSNIQFLESLPVFKDLEFQENGWGMYCPILKRTIEDKRFIYFEEINDEVSILNFNFKHVKEVSDWMKDKDNQKFVSQVENMLHIYQKSLIYKDMDRIELLNTVLECMTVLETDNFDSIYAKMEKWKMFENGYKNKAEKFKPEETRRMIDLIKEIK